MKRNYLLYLLFIITSTLSAQETNYNFDTKLEVKKQEKLEESPYSIFGDNTAVLQTKHEEKKDHTLKIPIVENDNQIGLFKMDFQTGIISMEDSKGNILDSKKLTKEELARFTTMDPMAEKYYSISPYAYVGNNPLNAIDLRGDTITTMIDGGKYTWGNVNGIYGFIDSNGTLYSGTNRYASDLTDALNTLRTGDVGKSLVDYLAGDAGNMTIRAPRPNSGERNSAFGSSGIIWDSNSTSLAGTNRPSFIGLGHELAHVQDSWLGSINNNTWLTVGGKTIEIAEQYATHIENQIRAEHNIPLRTHYAFFRYNQTGKYTGNPNTQIINSNTNRSIFYKEVLKIHNPLNGKTSLIPGVMPFKY